MILVTGATGTVGRHLLRELAAVGAPTRALVRTQDAASPVHGLGIQAAIGAFEDPTSLRRALAGVRQVFLLTPPGVDSMIRQQLRVLEAVMAVGGVTRIVKLSSIGADEPTDASIVAAHRRIEEEIERSGIAWTHIRPNWFMQNELGQADAVGRHGVFSAPDITHVSMIDARDIAEVAARVLISDGHEGRAYTLTGPEPISYPAVAATYSRVLGRPVRWQQVTLDQARSSMLAAGLPEMLATGFCEIMRGYQTGGTTRTVSPAVYQLTGHAPRSFESFVADHRAAYPAPAGATAAAH